VQLGAEAGERAVGVIHRRALNPSFENLLFVVCACLEVALIFYESAWDALVTTVD
jgi:hypothetical protein